MLEVINGFLLAYFMILCILSALVPQLGRTIAGCYSRPSSEERMIWGEIVKLKAEQKNVSMKDEFAAYSKLQRKINKLENHLKDNSQSRRTKSLAIKGSVLIILQVVMGLLIVASVIWFRREPIVVLKGDLFPLTTVLSYPSDMPNAISTHMWVLISNVSVRSLLRPVTS
ncbi:guided entry of tail-anchored proteins factor 1-like [Pectinophora gossypiella]|uniref:guided entry of tail-anchored proteins factor 1-like n=1 Tax=Pectinophora gossypiella TaxID=13191 RepID=UPI00214EC1DB|nr:guided entry of tail-anchored proteins factor 1-like [Pectinophora gossypiella]